MRQLREPCQYENCILCKEAADAIEELSKQIKALQCVNIGDLDCDNNQLCACMGIVRKRLEADAKKSRWIPVTERLPDKYHQVLVYGKNGFQIDYYAGEKSINGNPLFMISEAKVTHWMPLPEPPKEETC